MTNGVLVMAYGSPETEADIEPYLRDIRGGKPIRPGLLDELTERYRRAGLPSPLLATTRRQAAGIARALGAGFTVAIGMKHWTPRIRDGVAELVAAGVDRILGLPLAPHYSRISIGGYESRVRDALGPGVPLTMVHSWYDDDAYVSVVARNVRDALGDWAADDVHVFFTAHSLPERIIAEGDPYRDQLLATEKLVADAAGLQRHSFVFQSASVTGEPWLGPDLLDAMTRHAETHPGGRVLVCPVGFVTDHLEILYDIDVEAAGHARKLGLQLRRTSSLNDDPAFLGALAGVLRRAVA